MMNLRHHGAGFPDVGEAIRRGLRRRLAAARQPALALRMAGAAGGGIGSRRSGAGLQARRGGVLGRSRSNSAQARHETMAAAIVRFLKSFFHSVDISCKRQVELSY